MNSMKIKKILVLLLVAFMVSTMTIGNTYIHAEGSEDSSQQEEGTNGTPKEVSEDRTEIKSTPDKTETKEEAKTNQNDEPISAVVKQTGQTVANDVVPSSYDSSWGKWNIVASSSDMYQGAADKGILEIIAPGDIKIDGNRVDGPYCIKVIAPGTVNLTISNVSSSGGSGAAIIVENGSTLNLILEGAYNKLIGGGSGAGGGILVNEGANLIINDSEVSPGTLEVSGSGYGAAIGGPGSETKLVEGGTVTINGGLIYGGTSDAAFIGSGVNGHMESITINGGVIDGKCDGGAVIGSGETKNGVTGTGVDNITINDGTIMANHQNGAGIGSGGGGSSVTNIIINGGNITAAPYTSVGAGAGIGSGGASEVSNIIINGGNIIAGTRNNSQMGSGIGGGAEGYTESITINGGNITTQSDFGAGIGGGYYSRAVNNITITGGTISADTGSTSAQDIGVGQQGIKTGDETLYISGGSVYAVNNRIGPTPYNNATDKKQVYLFQLENQVSTNLVKVDGADYNVNGNHSETEDFFLYLVGGEDHFISVVNTSGSMKSCEAMWDNANQTFTLSTDRIAGDYYVKGGKKDIDWKYKPYSTSDNFSALEFLKDGEYEVYSCVEKSSQLINVSANVTLTINDLYIVPELLGGIFVPGSGTLNLKLVGENRIEVAADTMAYAAGIWVFKTATLNISGEGTLITKAINGAGIGGLANQTQGKIIIDSGTIDASSISGAGIGGSEGQFGRDITINGGNVTAKSVSGAGIGGGKNAVGGIINIHGGTVNATSTTGAGIGGGEASNATRINIDNATVNAASTDGAGIGGGKEGFGNQISLSNGYITAKSVNGDGVGSGASSTTESTDLEIREASVLATGQKDFSITPVNSSKEELALYELKNQKGSREVSVDGTPYSIFSGPHPGSSSYYLYLAKNEHTIGSEIHSESDVVRQTYNIKWYGSNSEGMFKLKSPTPVGDLNVSTAVNTMTVTPLTGETGTYGTIEYSVDGTTWQAENKISNLKADQTYTVYARYAGKGEYGESDPVTTSVQTKPAMYTITIPKAVTAGGEAQNVAINAGAEFDLGYDGQVNVKVSSGMTNTGVVTLTKTTTEISAQFKVNNTNFTDTSKNVATFKTKTDSPVSISVAKPTHTSGEIPAGTYKGKFDFTIEYQQ